MRDAGEPNDDLTQRLLWRAADQRALALLSAIALFVLAVGWWAYGGHRGGLVELDALPHRPAEFRVDLNTARATELALLPGIGNTLARRIVESRDADGPFRSADDLLRVKGIGAVTLQRVKPYLAPIRPPPDH